MNEQSSPYSQPAPQEPARPTGRCIVVFGTKGGVGKTAVAVNLAVSLAEHSRRPVCLVDLDTVATGDAERMLGLSPQHAVSELAALMRRPQPPAQLPLDEIILTHSSGIHVVPCLLNPRHGPNLDPTLLSFLFATLKARYDYVVVDGGKGLTDTLLSAFDEANLVLLVATPDVIALYQTKWAMSIIESLLFPANMVKGVLNRAESRGGVGSQEAVSAIPCEVISQIPSDGRAMGIAINEGIPVVKLYGMSKITAAFRRLAERIVQDPGLFLSHQQVPRHRRTAQGDGQNGQFARPLTGSKRLFAPMRTTSVRDTEDEIVALKRRIHGRLVEELDLKKADIGLLTDVLHMDEMRQRCERIIADILAREMGGVIASHEVRRQLVKEISDEALGLGPLEELLDDPTVTDILVNNKDQIYVERHGKLELTTKRFISDDQVSAVIERIVAPLGRRIDEANPMVDARLPDGSRVNAIIPPLSIKGPILSIRKFSPTRYTERDLIGFGSMTPEMAQFIAACVLGRKNLVVSGGTGSGKTTVLNVISAFIPEHERIVTIEDAAELQLAQVHWVSLEARPANVEGRGAVTIRDLFRNTLRMRPDRILIGECRGAESLDMLQAMNTGHDGSMTTIHANSPRDVVARLDSMVLMSSVELPIRAIREMIASAIHVIVHTARLSDGSRKVMSISELIGLSNEGEIGFQDVFRFEQSGTDDQGRALGRYVATGHIPTFLPDLKVKGIPIDDAIFRAGASGEPSGTPQG